MALSQPIGPLLHNDQLRALREQAEGLFGKAQAEVQPRAEAAERSAQGWMAYLPQIIEYAGLFAEMFRGKAEAAVASVPDVRRPGMIATVRPYVLGAVVLSAVGYAAYVVARNRR